MNSQTSAGVKSAQILSNYAELIKLSHTVFALPFALSMFVLLTRTHQISLSQLVFICFALISARTCAMAFNRIVDANIDTKNPRTAGREIPSGKVTKGRAALLCLVSALIFFASAGLLGPHCFSLAPFVLGILLIYSLTKRFTSLSHMVLGLALSLAPGGVWFAITAEWSFVPVLMMLAVLLWVFSFDILYSCQDADFDRAEGLFSIPARFGNSRAFLIARVGHALTPLFLVSFGVFMDCGAWYFTGVFVFAGFLFSQHLIVSPDNLERIDAAFFSRNGLASLLFFFFVSLDTWMM